MAKVILNLAISLDGFIARKDHKVDFLPEPDPNNMGKFNEFLNSIDTIIMGRGSYEVMLEFGEYPFKDKKTIIMTSKKFKPIKNFLFTNSPIEELIDNEDGNLWLFGGSKLIQSFTAKNLIDEYHITVTPTIIGSGIPLFLDFKNDINIELKDTYVFDDNITLIYTRKEDK